MIIACPACSTRYAVPDSAIGVDGRTVRCAKCRHSWFQEGPELVMEDVAPLTRAAPTRPSPPSSSSSAPSSTQPLNWQPTGAVPPQEEQTAPDRAAALDQDAPLPPAPKAAPRTVGAFYDDTVGARYADEAPSSFDHSPPFRPRRNWTKIGTIAAALFAVVTLSLAGTVAWFGLPDWVPIPRQGFTRSQPDLQLDFPRKRQDRKALPDGTEFFSVSGTISNVGSESRNVPSLLVVLRDDRERIVYEKEIVPAKRDLAPGEVVTVNEALTDIPKASAAAEIGWKPE